VRGLQPMHAAVIDVQPVVTRGTVIRFRESEAAGVAIDPARRAFQFQIDSDGRLIERGDAFFGAAMVFGAILLVVKRGHEIQAGQYLGETARIGDLDFHFLAILILTGIFAGGAGAFISENALLPGRPHAQQMPFATQRAARGIEESIGLKDAAFGYAETGGAQQAAARAGVRQSQLDLDFARGTGESYSFLPIMA